MAYCDDAEFGKMMVVVYAGDIFPNTMGVIEAEKRNQN